MKKHFPIGEKNVIGLNKRLPIDWNIEDFMSMF